MMELKPCPFCGCESVGVEESEEKNFRFNPEKVLSTVSTRYRIYCRKCGCGTYKSHYEEDAIEAWNRRADEKLTAELEGEKAEKDRAIENLSMIIKSAYEQRDAAIDDLITACSGEDCCTLCAHCCVDGKPIYRHDEGYLQYCKGCDDTYSNFEWRGVTAEGEGTNAPTKEDEKTNNQ